MYAALKSIASYVPQDKKTNKYFEQIVDTTDEWIQKRTGIKTRYFAKEGMHTSDLGVKASEIAIKRANIDKKNIDMVIVGTISPDYLCMPSTACVLASKLSLNNIPAFDISAACSGFIYLLSIAKAYIESKMASNILIVGAEKLSSILDMSDRSTCILFGDGAGAAIISSTGDKENSILDIDISSDGNMKDLLITPGGGSVCPASIKSVENKEHFMKMKGQETFKIAVDTLSTSVHKILERNGLSASDIDYFVPHQANQRIIKAVGKILHFKKEQIVLTVDKFGNTSSASIPMAIDYMFNQGILKGGEKLLLDAFGGGLTWGSAILSFNQ